MSSFRLPLLLAVLVLGLVLTAPALAQSTGGTLAQPPLQGPGGGSLAPAEGDVLEPAPVEVPPYVNLAPPTAMSAQAGSDAVEPPATRTDGGTPAGDPAAVPAQQSADAAQAGSDSDGVGSLPFTGFELAALAGIGLSLLAAGIALRPRRPAPS